MKTTSSAHDMGVRADNADRRFVRALTVDYGLSADVAERVFAHYRKDKLNKYSHGVGAWTVVHGAYLAPKIVRAIAKAVA